MTTLDRPNEAAAFSGPQTSLNDVYNPGFAYTLARQPFSGPQTSLSDVQNPGFAWKRRAVNVRRARETWKPPTS